MPMFDWIDDTSGTKTSIIRTFDESERGPDREDVPNMSEEDWAVAQWRKVLSAPTWQRGYGWRGSKGNW